MKILGIDPGFDKLGYALLTTKEGEVKKIESGLIKTKVNESISKRIENVYLKLKDFFEIYKPDFVVLEDLFLFKNKKTVIKVAQIQGIVLLLAAQNKIKIEILSPLQIKKAITGYGRADKKAIEKIIYLTLPLERRKREDDETDAIACAFAGFLLLKGNNMVRKVNSS